MKTIDTINMKRMLFFTMLIPALLLGSCIAEGEMDGGKQSRDGQLRLKMTIKGVTAETVTRTPVSSEAGEDDVTTLYLLFFEPGADGSGQYVDYVEIKGLTPEVSTPIDMTEHPLLGVSSAYNILAVANIDQDCYITGDVYTWMLRWNGKTEAQVKADATGWIYGGDDNTNAISPSQLLMTGSVKKAAEQYEIELELTRNMVRYDVVNSKKEAYDLVSAEVWNVYPSDIIWDGAVSNYANTIARTPRFYGVDNSANTTGVNGDDGKGSMLGDIMGGLYSFANQVIAPKQNDHLTTCLIVGLKDRATGTTQYHRVNIHPDESAQILNGNSVYRLTIRGVIGDGALTAQAAYEAPEAGLDYVINNWDMGDSGVIVQDGNSILAIPSKTVTMDENGGELSYEIFTFNNKGAGTTLSIKSQNYDAMGINATLSGNTLIVTATPLANPEDERTGQIVLQYNGLEATVYVIQNNGDDVYLRVHLPAEELKALAPYGGIGTGNLRVEASGPWTAELFMPEDGFTFDLARIEPNIALTKLQSSNAALVTDNEFRVYTWSPNPKALRRDCFIVVTLDSDPENYAQVVQLAQSPMGGISVLPVLKTVTFNGLGTGLAAVAGNTSDTFNVCPSMEDDGSGGEQIAEWKYKIIPVPGRVDDTAMFNVTNKGHSQTTTADNTITVGAVGKNTSGRSYTAILRLYLGLDEDAYTEITLVQQSLGISMAPGTLPEVAMEGGESGLIKVVGDASLMWKATFTQNDNAAPDGRRLVHHEATLVDQNGDEIVEGQLYPMTTQMRVQFPKIYYPNREIPISATIDVTAEGLTSSITVHQTTLTPRKMTAYGMTGAPDYGGLGNTYSRGWEGESGTWGLRQIPGYIQLGVGNMNVVSIPASVNYLQVAPHIGGTAGDNYNWSVINDYIDSRDAWTVLMVQDYNGTMPMNNPQSPMKRNGIGYNDSKYNASSRWSKVYNQGGGTPKKLYEFVMDRGHTPLQQNKLPSEGFYNDGVNTSIEGPWPESAVVLMTKLDDDNLASLIVDIEHKFLWMGESQIFWYDAYLTNNRGVFLDNIMYFISNASKYGSAFTDLFLEDDRPGAQPAPWDTSYWGANVGVPSK